MPFLSVALRGGRAASYKNPAFVPSFRHINILLNERYGTSRSRANRSFCNRICTSSTDNGLIKNEYIDEYIDDTSICKEVFEVGSRLVSLETAMNMESDRLKIVGIKRVESITKGAVLMNIEKTKVLSIAEAGDWKRKDYCVELPELLHVLYSEREFIHAQMVNHDAVVAGNFKKFPSHALMERPNGEKLIRSAIRLLFPYGYYSHDAVYSTTDVLESDGQHDPVIMAANTASAALMVSGILWNGPIGVVRIGRIRGSEDGAFVVNPTMDQMICEGLDLNLVYACTKDRTLVIELEASEVSDKDVEAALRLAHNEAVKYLEPQIRLAERAGAQKKDYKLYMIIDQSRRRIENKVMCLAAEPRFKEASNNGLYVRERLWDEIERDVEEAVSREECSCNPPPDTEILCFHKKIVPRAVDKMKNNVGRRMIIEKGLRDDGRLLDQVRKPQYCESGALPVHYGSSIFWLGHTRVLCHLKLLDTSDKSYLFEEDEVPDLHEMYEKRPTFNINDHGDRSTKKAFLAVLPPEDDFPYDVDALVSVVVDSGPPDHCSSSIDYMASICGASLALMDAGIQLKRHIAGVSMGVVSDVDPSTGMIKAYRIITDIDSHDLQMSDMNMKIAGTRKGVTAIRLDIETPSAAGTGIPLDIICECLQPAVKAHHQVLEYMEQEIDSPRRIASTFVQNGRNWPTLDSESFSIDENKGVYNMDSLRRLELTDRPAATVADNQMVLESKKERALEALLGFRNRLGRDFEGTICLIKEGQGVFVEMNMMNGDLGFLPLSEIVSCNEDDDHKEKISDLLSVGQCLSVTYTGYDTSRGLFKLSLKSPN